MKKRVLALILLIVMLLTSMISCKKDTEEGTEESSAADNTDTVTTEAKNDDAPEIPEITIDRAITVYKRQGATVEEWDPEQDTSGFLVMNDALFERNAILQDKYGITFDFIGSPKDTVIADFGTMVSAGEDVVDFVVFDSQSLYELARAGYLRKVNDLTYCNYDKDYWYGNNYKDLLNKDGSSYLTFGYSNLAFQWCSYSVYYNKTIFEDNYKGDNIYQLVFDKKWTLERMYQYAKGVAEAGPNDSDVTDDMYGIIMPGGGWYSTFFGSGLQAVERDDNGNFVSNLTNQTFLGHLQRVLDITADNKVTLESTRYADVNVLFAGGKGLFYTESFTLANYFQSYMDDYGVLPAPLMNEGDNYYTHTHYTWSSATAIPITLGDDKLDEVSILLEDANYHAKKIQTPVMIETVLKGRVAKDYQSVETMDIILSNIHIDPAFVHTAKDALSFDGAYRNLIRNASKAGTSVGLTLASDMATCHQNLVKHLNDNVNK